MIKSVGSTPRRLCRNGSREHVPLVHPPTIVLTLNIRQCMFICGAYVLFKRTFSNVIRKGFRSVFIYFMTSSTRIINYDNEICTGICKNSRIHIFSFFRSILFLLSYPVNLHVVGFSFFISPDAVSLVYDRVTTVTWNSITFVSTFLFDVSSRPRSSVFSLHSDNTIIFTFVNVISI